MEGEQRLEILGPEGAQQQPVGSNRPARGEGQGDHSPVRDPVPSGYAGTASRVGSERPDNVTDSRVSHRSASDRCASCRTDAEARRRSERRFARSVSRDASLTGSPITVYSKRLSAPTLPATTGPTETPIPAL